MLDIPVVDDSMVAEKLTMAESVDCMERAFQEHAKGSLSAPARFGSDLGVGQLMFTAGGCRSAGSPLGFRVYDMKQLGSPLHSELVAVFSGDDGGLRGLVVGPYLGALRTGAIGGVAVKHLSRPDATRLAIVGAGTQARTQLMAASSVRDFEDIQIYSRTASRLQAFCEEMSGAIGKPVTPSGSAREAVENADVVVCATTSEAPVIRFEWLKSGVHVNAIGPKFKDAHEMDLDMADRCQCLVTDTLVQMEEFGEAFVLSGTEHYDRVVDLAEIVAGTRPARQSETDNTLFYSLGLAGTEVLLADHLFSRING